MLSVRFRLMLLVLATPFIALAQSFGGGGRIRLPIPDWFSDGPFPARELWVIESLCFRPDSTRAGGGLGGFSLTNNGPGSTGRSPVD